MKTAKQELDRPVSSWGASGWTAWGLCTATTVLLALLAGYLVSWRASAGCGKLGTAANVRTGRSELGVAAMILCTPWLLALTLARLPWRPMLFAMTLTLLPLTVVAATHTRPSDWNYGGFCF